MPTTHLCICETWVCIHVPWFPLERMLSCVWTEICLCLQRQIYIPVLPALKKSLDHSYSKMFLTITIMLWCTPRRSTTMDNSVTSQLCEVCMKNTCSTVEPSLQAPRKKCIQKKHLAISGTFMGAFYDSKHSEEY